MIRRWILSAKIIKDVKLLFNIKFEKLQIIFLWDISAVDLPIDFAWNLKFLF